MSDAFWLSPGFNASLATQIAFPPGTQCWANLTSYGDTQDSVDIKAATKACTGDLGYHVTQPMVDFLNITQDMDHYFQAYCLNPRSDDSCPFYYCSQSDVAGILVRVSTYVATLCLAIMLFFSDEPDEVAEAYWSQILTLYSILVAAAISVFKTSLTKFHAIVAVELVASPLTFYLAIYAIRSFFNHEHRLDRLLGRGKLHYRMMAIGTLAVLVAFFIYILLPSHIQKFSQASCDAKSVLIKLNFFLPVIFFAALFAYGGLVPSVLVTLPFILIAFSWVATVYIRRHELWYKTGKRENPSFWSVWTMVGKNYPFIHFMAVYIIPYTLWVLTVETSLIDSNDQTFEVSFGQILAMFVTIPPLISVAKMSPRFGRWFINLAWLRFVTGRSQNSHSSHDSVPLAVVGSLRQSATSVNWPHRSNSKYEELKDMEAGYEDPFDKQKRSGITRTH